MREVLHKLIALSFHNIYLYQIISSCAVNLKSGICHLYLSKAEEKNVRKEKKVICGQSSLGKVVPWIEGSSLEPWWAHQVWKGRSWE